jgi:hypothetical protein
MGFWSNVKEKAKHEATYGIGAKIQDARYEAPVIARKAAGRAGQALKTSGMAAAERIRAEAPRKLKRLEQHLNKTADQQLMEIKMQERQLALEERKLRLADRQRSLNERKNRHSSLPTISMKRGRSIWD